MRHYIHGVPRFLAQSPDGCLWGPALELISVQGTAIGTTIAALAASTGDSLAVRSTPEPKRVDLIQLWADVQTAGTLRVRSPRMHDNVQGIRIDTTASDPTPLLPFGVRQRLYGNDVIGVDLGGSATAGDIEYVILMLLYEDLAGANARFISPDELLRRAIHHSAVENTISTGTGGGWTGSEAINNEFDQFHASKDYALVGYKVDAEGAAVAWRGPDTSNYRVGGPAIETEVHLTTDWFIRMSKALGIPLIPVFSAENKAGTNVDAVQDENGTDITVTSYFVELAK